MTAENAKWSRQAGYEDLEKLATEMGDDAASIFDEHLAGGGELIDVEFELMHPDIFDYATVLTRTLGYEATQRAHAAAYRAAHYAYLLSEQFLDHPVIMTSGYFGRDETEEQMQARILYDTQTYLQHRPMLDAMIGRYIPEIDPSQRYATLVESITALVFLQVEINEKAKFIDEATAELGTSLAVWDGDLGAIEQEVFEA